METKHCVGVLIYNEHKEVLLIQNPKWKDGTYWMAPGGGIEPGETEEDAVHRETMEEVGIRVTDLYKLGEQKKLPSADFTNNSLAFHFYDYAAMVLPGETILPDNREVKTFAWFTVKEAMQLQTTDTMKHFLHSFNEYIQTV